MARRGWVAAQTGPDEWMRLQVFDDGWVELPGLGRSLSDSRAELRRALTGLGVFLGGLGMIYLLLVGPSKLEDPPLVVQLLPGALTVVLLAWAAVILGRKNSRARQQARGDARQARAFRSTGRRISRTPGAPLWRRVSTAEELAGWLEGETHVRAADITDVTVARDGTDYLVTAR